MTYTYWENRHLRNRSPHQILAHAGRIHQYRLTGSSRGIIIDPMDDPILNTWDIHHRLNLAFIESINSEALSSHVPAMRRTVGHIIAHLHNNRLSWLEHITPELSANLQKVANEQITDKLILLSALQASGEAIHQALEHGLAHGGKLKAFPGPAAVFLGYMIAHDSYHHGEISLILTQTGHRLPRESAYHLWDWKSY